MSSIPQHIAIIMDGNGRWARKRFLPRVAGHKAGVDAARKVVTNCLKRHIKVLSLFAFSSENWNRPAKEVSYLMDIFLVSLEREANMLHENNIQLRFIGDRLRFSEKLKQKIIEIEQLTANNSAMVLIIAIDYGGKWDITQAAVQLAQEVEAGKLTSAEITQTTLSNKLSFADLPDPDLFIRTSGELRISNFMLWQLAYAELFFCHTLWPDFDEKDLDNALAHYAERDRRFGSHNELSELTC